MTRTHAVTIGCAALVTLTAVASLQARSRGVSGGNKAPAVKDRGVARSIEEMPGGLALSASAAVGASERRFWVSEHAGSLQTRGVGIAAAFTAAGAHIRVAAGTLDLILAGVGRGSRLARSGATAPTGVKNTIEYGSEASAVSYRNGPYGLEQGFAIARRPGGRAGWLSLAIGLGGSLRPRRHGDGEIAFLARAGTPALRYSGLRAVDASGRELPARMALKAIGC